MHYMMCYYFIVYIDLYKLLNRFSIHLLEKQTQLTSKTTESNNLLTFKKLHLLLIKI